MLEALVFEYIRQREKAGRFNGRTPETKASILLGFASAADCEPSKLTRKQVNRWLGSQSVGSSTLHAKFTAVRSFVSWLREEGHLTADPFKGLDPPKKPIAVPRALQQWQVEKLFTALPDRRAELIVLLMVQQGLRCAEVATTELGLIDFTEKTMIVNGKGRKQRMLPIFDECFSAIQIYRSELGTNDRSGYLIRNERRPHSPISPGWVSGQVAQWMRDAGIKDFAGDGVAAHSLRHTAATDLLRNGASLREVQMFLGHASLATTERYLRVDMADLRKAGEGRRYRP